MMRCFSVWPRSQLGHLYVTILTSNPADSARAGTVSLNWGLRKFSTSQKVTGRDDRFVTDSIMILRNRSYRCPDASEKTWMRSSFPATAVEPAEALPPKNDRTEPQKPREVSWLACRATSAASSSSSTSSFADSNPGLRRTRSCVTSPTKSRTVTSREATLSISGSSSSASSPISRCWCCPTLRRTPLRASPGRRPSRPAPSGMTMSYSCVARPGASASARTPGCALSWKYPRFCITSVSAMGRKKSGDDGSTAGAPAAAVAGRPGAGPSCS
mmetsp:Transcript_2327/g.9077  ORF Transcript_2327/g.9077 Transcript_2327/m.9077 type:complete len:272 (+) Transcript_2327:904-1719(+)